jgi:predicted metalloprotease
VSGSGPAAPTPEPTATPQPVSLEDRFGYNQMPQFLDAILPMVRQFFESEYPDLPAPRDVVLAPSGRAGRGACGVYDDQAFEYCGANQTIYIGQDLLWPFYSRFGDAAAAIAIAHEWGHHLQTRARVGFPNSNSQSVRFENQADCVAGAWARYADQQGWLERPDDLQDVDGLLVAIGARETSRRDHGTAAERRSAFNAGFARGLEACNQYSLDGRPIANLS